MLFTAEGRNQYGEDEAHVVRENKFPEIHLTEHEYPKSTKKFLKIKKINDLIKYGKLL